MRTSQPLTISVLHLDGKEVAAMFVHQQSTNHIQRVYKISILELVADIRASLSCTATCKKYLQFKLSRKGGGNYPENVSVSVGG